MKTVCQNCNARRDESKLKEIKDLWQRIGPGDTAVPVGECPDCGALCHEVGDVRRLGNQEKLNKLVKKLLDELGGDIFYDSLFDSAAEVKAGGSSATKGVERVNDLTRELKKLVKKI